MPRLSKIIFCSLHHLQLTVYPPFKFLWVAIPCNVILERGIYHSNSSDGSSMLAAPKFSISRSSFVVPGMRNNPWLPGALQMARWHLPRLPGAETAKERYAAQAQAETIKLRRPAGGLDVWKMKRIKLTRKRPPRSMPLDGLLDALGDTGLVNRGFSP